MPYAMKHSQSGTLLACVQRNGYELAYYGIKLWEEEPSSAQLSEALAEAGIGPEDAENDLSEWEHLALSEHEAKMANVKLRNDPLRVVAHRDGALVAQTVRAQG